VLRVSLEAVAKIVVDVVADAIDDARSDDLYRIGVDEFSCRCAGDLPAENLNTHMQATGATHGEPGSAEKSESP
jgi:hypothetical protein